MRHKNQGQAVIAILMIPALVLFSVGCKSTKTVQVQTSVPPAPDSEDRIVGLTETSGETVEFSEPARIESREQLDAMVVGTVALMEAERQQALRFEIPVSEVARFELERDEKTSSTWKTVALIGGVAVVGLVALAVWSANEVYEPLNCVANVIVHGSHCE